PGEDNDQPATAAAIEQPAKEGLRLIAFACVVGWFVHIHITPIRIPAVVRSGVEGQPFAPGAVPTIRAIAVDKPAATPRAGALPMDLCAPSSSQDPTGDRCSGTKRSTTPRSIRRNASATKGSMRGANFPAQTSTASFRGACLEPCRPGPIRAG